MTESVYDQGMSENYVKVDGHWIPKTAWARQQKAAADVARWEEADRNFRCPNPECGKPWGLQAMCHMELGEKWYCPHCYCDEKGWLPPKPAAPKAFVLSHDPDLDVLVKECLAENPKAVQDWRAGKGQAMGFLIGWCKKKNKNAAPEQIKARLEKCAL